MLDDQTRMQLTQKFQQIKPQLKQRYSDLSDDDLRRAESDPDSLVMMISQKTGQDETQIEQQIKSLVASGGQA